MRRRIFLWMGLSVLFISFLGLGSEALADTTYKVKRGDTLAKVSKKFGVGIQALRSANALSGNALKPNQVLNIPGEGKKTAAVKRGPRSSEGRYYTVKRGDTLAGIARENKVSIADLRKANHLRGTALKPGQRLALAGKRTRRRPQRCRICGGQRLPWRTR